jgi:hypothetical protein
MGVAMPVAWTESSSKPWLCQRWSSEAERRGAGEKK